jgi:hypothetical protein
MRHQAKGGMADMSWFRHGFRAVAMLLIGAALVWTVAACGSGAVEGPDDEASSDGGGGNGGSGNGGSGNGGSGNGGSGNGGGGNGGGGNGGGGNGGGGNGGGDEFPWGLPPGDTSAAAQEAIIYGLIEQGRCEDAQTSLDEGWRILNGPRAVLLYQAAIHFCRGERDAGRQRFVQAGDLFGWEGVNWPSLDCNVFKAIRSVLEQRAKEAIEDCPGGETPLWPEDVPAESRDDPRTPEDDGATSTPTEPSTTTTSTEPPSDSDTTTTGSTEPSSSTDVGGSEATVGNRTGGDG